MISRLMLNLRDPGLESRYLPSSHDDSELVSGLVFQAGISSQLTQISDAGYHQEEERPELQGTDDREPGV